MQEQLPRRKGHNKKLCALYGEQAFVFKFLQGGHCPPMHQSNEHIPSGSAPTYKKIKFFSSPSASLRRKSFDFVFSNVHLWPVAYFESGALQSYRYIDTIMLKPLQFIRPIDPL